MGAGVAGAGAGRATSVEALGRPITERARATAPRPATARIGILYRFQSGTRSFGTRRRGATWAAGDGVATGISGGGAIVGVTTSGSSSMSPSSWSKPNASGASGSFSAGASALGFTGTGSFDSIRVSRPQCQQIGSKPSSSAW